MVAQCRQLAGETRRVAGFQAVGDFRDVLVAEVARRLRDLSVDQADEGRRLIRQHVRKAKVLAAAWAPGLRFCAKCGDHLQHPLDGFGVDPGASVEHAVNRGGAHACQAGDVGDGGCGGHVAVNLMWSMYKHQ